MLDLDAGRAGPPRAELAAAARRAVWVRSGQLHVRALRASRACVLGPRVDEKKIIL